MQENGLCGIPIRKRYSKPSPVDDDTPDLVRRKLQTLHPNEVWVTDLTEIKTGEDKLCLCVIKDLYDGVVVAWRTGVRQTKELVMATVDTVWWRLDLMASVRSCIQIMVASTRATIIARVLNAVG
ncbi:MAG: DDE-type integrase/transposase/recombinase [Gammaproteobacteria bacterium]|nr:DDE-type integrase/transposase/recombinase [Gammaproteobacteria bacterium]